MTTLRNVKYLSVVALIGVWGCSSNQYASRSGVEYDDLYGNSSDVEVAVRNRPANEARSRYDNPDFQSTDGVAANEGTTDYYDENYLSSRKVQRPVSDEVGYNAGFREGYIAGQTAVFDPFFMNSYGGFWPGSSAAFRMGFQVGVNRSMRLGFSPFIGMGGMYGMGRMGYSPWGMYRPWGFDPFWGSSMAYGGFGMPYGYGMYGMGDPFWGMNSWGSPFGGMYGGMYGYGFNPWAYNRPVVIVNNNSDRNEYRRTYGPRGSATGRSTDTYNRGFVNTTRSSRNANANAAGRQGANAGYDNSAATNSRGTTSSDAYYARPRSNSSGTYYGGNSSTGRSSAEGTSTYSGSESRRSSSNGDYYYSRPRSNSSGTYSGSTGTSRSYGTSSQPSSRTYDSGTRSNSTYQAPSRQSSPSWGGQSSPRSSAPASMPSGGGGGGGSSAPRSRGPR
ncbi:hypothetical protein [Telluribacter sp. SYSU D00476]|uniref:hypothetical protein n=1 Tax=Telluribacter sp. SYSU D00476 TaxID=2811430 RepID=UPI001FF49E5B|nr:hypothetical protein [Telluribacter sp. SYSU D00476]